MYLGWRERNKVESPEGMAILFHAFGWNPSSRGPKIGSLVLHHHYMDGKPNTIILPQKKVGCSAAERSPCCNILADSAKETTGDETVCRSSEHKTKLAEVVTAIKAGFSLSVACWLWPSMWRVAQLPTNEIPEWLSSDQVFIYVISLTEPRCRSIICPDQNQACEHIQVNMNFAIC